MYELLWLLTDGADWETLILGPLHTLVARGLTLANRNTLKSLRIKKTHLCSIAVGPRVNQGYVEVEAHVIDILPGFLIVQSIYYQVKLTEELEAKSFLLLVHYQTHLTYIRPTYATTRI